MSTLTFLGHPEKKSRNHFPGRFLYFFVHEPCSNLDIWKRVKITHFYEKWFIYYLLTVKHKRQKRKMLWKTPLFDGKIHENWTSGLVFFLIWFIYEKILLFSSFSFFSFSINLPHIALASPRIFSHIIPPITPSLNGKFRQSKWLSKKFNWHEAMWKCHQATFVQFW